MDVGTARSARSSSYRLGLSSLSLGAAPTCAASVSSAEGRRSRRGVQKGGLDQAVARIAQSHPGAAVEVWAEDEARVGLLPLARRVWAKVGQRPRMSSRRRYQWRYVFAFVHPSSGRTEWVITTTVSTGGMSAVLRHFAQLVGAGERRRIALVIDGADWHTSNDPIVPEGIHLIFQPPYSPELQPAEQLWPLLHEPLANRDFVDLDELEDVVGSRCCELSDQPALVQARTKFHWWPADRPSDQATHADS